MRTVPSSSHLRMAACRRMYFLSLLRSIFTVIEIRRLPASGPVVNYCWTSRSCFWRRIDPSSSLAKLPTSWFMPGPWPLERRRSWQSARRRLRREARQPAAGRRRIARVGFDPVGLIKALVVPYATGAGLVALSARGVTVIRRQRRPVGWTMLPMRRGVIAGVVAAIYGVFTRWSCWSSTQGCLTNAQSVSPAAVITAPLSCRPLERMYTPSSSRSSASTV